MKIFCETIFNYLISPSVKSLITKELIETYGLTQEEVAKKLAITQPAVSQYLSGLRGKKVHHIVSNPILAEWVKKLTAEIASGQIEFTNLYEDGRCQMCTNQKPNTERELRLLQCLMEIEKRTEKK